MRSLILATIALAGALFWWLGGGPGTSAQNAAQPAPAEPAQGQVTAERVEPRAPEGLSEPRLPSEGTTGEQSPGLLGPQEARRGSYAQQAEQAFQSGIREPGVYLTLCMRAAMDLLESSGQVEIVQGTQRLRLSALEGDRLPIYRSRAQATLLGWASSAEFPVLPRLLECRRSGRPSIEELYTEIIDLCGRADLILAAGAGTPGSDE
jgi:hypothetical protein